MNTSDKPEPITNLLRRTIAQAIAEGRTNYLTLERETGVTRASIRRFVNGERSLHLDVADQLAAYFGLEFRPKRMDGWKMSGTVPVFASYPNSDTSLAFLKPILCQMFAIIDRYLSKWGLAPICDRPYGYNERATLSLLAGAVWRSNPGNMVMEEYCEDKQGEECTYRGRFDIWFETDGRECCGEAKQHWPSMAGFDDDEAGNIIKMLRAEADVADNNIHKADLPAQTADQHAVGIVFVVPSLSLRSRKAGPELFECMANTMNRHLMQFATSPRESESYSVVRASYFRPDLLTEKDFVETRRWGKQAYPGIDVLICERRKG